MRVNLSIDVHDLSDSLAESLTGDELLELICSLDLKVADVGFTEDCVRRLVKSLRLDYTESEVAEFIASLEKTK